MKRIIALLIISCLSINCFAQMQAKVDERIELTSIVFRLAGMEEFTAGQINEYEEAIDKWFGKYSSHRLIDWKSSHPKATSSTVANHTGKTV